MLSRKEIVKKMEEEGALEYGAHISGDRFRSICGIETISIGTYDEVKKMELEELAAADHVRNYLLNLGRYFKHVRDGYRVLLPSENMDQVRAYMRAADTKLKRAIKLDKNTPTEYKETDTEHVRMVMKREHIKEKIRHAK